MTFFDVADLAFAVNSAGVHRARRNSRYARTSYGLAVPRHGGVHYCLGHLIARTDMSEALAALARRLREPRVSGDAVWLPCSGNTGPVRLPIAFTTGY